MHRAGQLIRAWREAHSPPLSAEEFGALHGQPQAWPSRTVYGWEIHGKVPRAPVQRHLAQIGICQPADWLDAPLPTSDNTTMTTPDSHPFHALHSHGFVRVAHKQRALAAATPGH